MTPNVQDANNSVSYEASKGLAYFKLSLDGISRIPGKRY